MKHLHVILKEISSLSLEYYPEMMAADVHFKDGHHERVTGYTLEGLENTIIDTIEERIY